MPADHTHLIDNARHRHEQTLQRAHKALTELADAGEPITVSHLAQRASVSRSWIYTQPELQQKIHQLQHQHRHIETARGGATRATDESLRQRLAIAHQRISELRTENQQLRDALAHAHGQLRIARLDSDHS
ncbi:MAG: transposase [Mycobacterium sp.]|nr:transposase [Mycobacterium sp.]